MRLKPVCNGQFGPVVHDDGRGEVATGDLFHASSYGRMGAAADRMLM